MEYDRSKLKFHDKQETVWVVEQAAPGSTLSRIVGVAVADVAAPDLPGVDRSRQFSSTKTILHRPSLAPIYGGPTLLEALWHEMDRLMEDLMTGQEAEADVCNKSGCFPIESSTEDGTCGHPDNGNRYRAEELAWVLAIVTNAYEPSMDAIREEAMRRWNEAQA